MPFKSFPSLRKPSFPTRLPLFLTTLVPKSRLRRGVSALLLTLGGVYGYQMYDTGVELVHNKGEQARRWVDALGDSVSGRYFQSPQTPFRFMEIIYGNVLDRREYCSFRREVVHLRDGENIALGVFNRLAVGRHTFNKSSNCGVDSGSHWMQ